MMKMKFTLLALLLTNLGVAYADVLGPLNPLIQNLTPNIIATDSPWVLSEEFTANNTVQVTALGFFDNNSANTTSHEVGLYDASGNLLASANIAAGENYQNYFDWTSIAAVTLTAGKSYVIAGVSNSDGYEYKGSYTVNPDYTLTGYQYLQSGTLSDPSLGGTGYGDDGFAYFGPNLATSVPEPETYTLFALGLLGLAYARRKA